MRTCQNVCVASFQLGHKVSSLHSGQAPPTVSCYQRAGCHTTAALTAAMHSGRRGPDVQQGGHSTTWRILMRKETGTQMMSCKVKTVK